jgi:hypothetical protein
MLRSGLISLSKMFCPLFTPYPVFTQARMLSMSALMTYGLGPHVPILPARERVRKILEAAQATNLLGTLRPSPLILVSGS